MLKIHAYLYGTPLWRYFRQARNNNSNQERLREKNSHLVFITREQRRDSINVQNRVAEWLRFRLIGRWLTIFHFNISMDVSVMCISPCAMLNRMIWMWKIGRKSIFVDSSERSQSEVIMKVVENAAAVFFCFFNLARANENQNWSENEFFKNCLKFHSQLVCMSASLKQQKNVSLLFFHIDVITLTATRREEKYYLHTGKKHIVQLGQKREKNLKKREREKNYLFLQHAKRMTWINYVGNRSAQPHRAWLRRIQIDEAKGKRNTLQRKIV